MRLRAIAAILAMMQAGSIGGRTTTHQYAMTVYVIDSDRAPDSSGAPVRTKTSTTGGQQNGNT